MRPLDSASRKVCPTQGHWYLRAWGDRVQGGGRGGQEARHMEENLSAIWGVINAHNLQAMFSEHSDNKQN